jgi:hypothetical protein
MQTPFVLEDVVLLSSYIKAELNVHNLTVCNDAAKYKVQLRAEAKSDVLGPRLQVCISAYPRLNAKGSLRAVVTALQQLSQAQLEAFQVRKQSNSPPQNTIVSVLISFCRARARLLLLVTSSPLLTFF